MSAQPAQRSSSNTSFARARSALVHVAADFTNDKVLRLASSIAFSALFSLAPLLIVLIAILGWVLGWQNGGHGHHLAEDALLANIQRGAGKSTADAVRSMVAASFNRPRVGLIAQVVGWVTFLIGAGALFSSLQDAFNSIWHIEFTKGTWKQMVRDRAASFGMILVIGFLLFGTMLASSALSIVSARFAHAIPSIGMPVLSIIDGGVGLAIGTVAFALMYRILPDVEIAWRDVWVSAAVTAVLFEIGEALIAWYLAKAGVASAYGAAGSLLALILWLYYSAIILLIGVELTKVSATRVHTTEPTLLRSTSSHPAGVDPRKA